MKSTFISKEDNKVKFTMDFTAEEFEQAVVKVYQAKKGQFNIDGFRRGKAPRSIIERYYGEGVFFEDAVNELFQTAYPEALKELDLEVVDMPNAEFSEIGKGKPLTITINVPVYPVVEVKDYKGLAVEKTKAVVSDEEVDQEIEKLQKRNSRMVSVERPVENGDTVILDYAGFVGEEQFEGGTAENQSLKIGSGTFIPGFEEQLVGAEVGKEVDVKVTFPENYQAENLAGKDAVFHCTVHEVKVEEFPELDDEFAKDVSEFDTMEELKEDARKRLQESADLRSENEAKDKLIQMVSEANKVEVPRSMIEDEIDNMCRDFEQQMRYQGLTLDQYLQFTGSNMKDFRETLKDEAAKRVNSRVILRSIGTAENIEVTEEDLEKELTRMGEAYQMEAEKVREMIGEENLSYFKKDILITKVIDLLYDQAEVTEVEPKAAEPESEEAPAEAAEETAQDAE